MRLLQEGDEQLQVAAPPLHSTQGEPGCRASFVRGEAHKQKQTPQRREASLKADRHLQACERHGGVAKEAVLLVQALADVTCQKKGCYIGAARLQHLALCCSRDRCHHKKEKQATREWLHATKGADAPVTK